MSPAGENRAPRRVLFVCTANICRSPMAEAIFEALAADRGLDFEAESAGVAAPEGAPMAREAVAALEEVGIHPGHDHRARPVSREMLRRADLVLAMTPRHTAELRRLAPELSEKAHVLPRYAGGPDDAEVPDPYGYPMSFYRACVRQLYECIHRVVDDLDRPSHEDREATQNERPR